MQAPAAAPTAQPAATNNNSQSNIAEGLANTMTGGIYGGVSSLIGTGFSALGNAIFNTQGNKDAEQLKQQAALDQQQLQYNEQMSDYSEQKQQQLWNGTNSLALAQQAAQQGYNPALIYGGGGGGGSTGSGAANVNAPQASSSSEQQQAEAATTNANTNKQNANTASALAAAEIPKTQAGTSLIIQQTGNAVIDQQTKELNNQYQTIQNTIATATTQTQIDTIVQNLTNMVRQGQTMLSQGMLNDANRFTIDAIRPSVIAQQQEMVKNILSQTIKNYAGANLDDATAHNMAEKLILGYKELHLQANGQEVSVENVNKMCDTQLKSAVIGAAGNAIGGVLKGLMATGL
nr:MAG: DNA pilot protein [Microviridae sp.]